jgi:hypothetical protein
MPSLHCLSIDAYLAEHFKAVSGPNPCGAFVPKLRVHDVYQAVG